MLDLDLDLMTFIYELYSLKMYRMIKMNLMSRLSTVIVLHTHTGCLVYFIICVCF